MLTIDLDELQNGLPGFTPIASSYLAEATAYCLMYSGHNPGIDLTLQEGDNEKLITIKWHSELSPDVAITWQDEQELVEYAAVGIALPLILQLTNYTDVQRARKGGGVDFWLGRKDENGFSVLEASLEISGILKENQGNTVNARVQRKKLQVQQSAYKNLPVYIVVVEFSKPKAKMEQL